MKPAHISTARLESLGDGRFRVSGVLDAFTAPHLLEQSMERFGNSPLLLVDLAGVSEGDSAGLALLIEWLRMARERGLKIRFASVPAQIAALARISEVEDLLASGEGAAAAAPAS